MSAKTAETNKKTFEIDIDNGPDKPKTKKKLAVKKPDHDQQQYAVLVYNRAFREAVQPEDGQKGALVRAVLENILAGQGFWDETKKARFKQLDASLKDGEKKLAKGGIKLSEGRDIAIQMRRDRFELQQLQAERNALDLNTAEAQAENVKFAYLVSACTWDPETGKPYFKSVDDYNKRANDPDALAAATAFGQLQYGVSDDIVGRLPENKWLRCYKFTDAQHRLVNKQGEFVDAQNRRVDADGNLINEANQRIGEDGELLNDDGSVKVEFVPFLDDEGNAVPAPADAETPAKVAVDAAAGESKTAAVVLDVPGKPSPAPVSDAVAATV